MLRCSSHCSLRGIHCTGFLSHSNFSNHSRCINIIRLLIDFGHFNSYIDRFYNSTATLGDSFTGLFTNCSLIIMGKLSDGGF